MVSLYIKSVCFLLISLCSFANSRPNWANTKVHLSHEWKPRVGWVVTCSWELVTDDKLMSVTFYKNGERVASYRPDFHFTHVYPTSNNNIEATCDEAAAKCILTIVPTQPPEAEFNMRCEVVGDSPTFRIEEKLLSIETVVPPTDAVIEVTRTEDSKLALNCSASGIPAPEIEWTLGNDDTKPGSFIRHSVWNSKSKLYDTWATFIPTSNQLPVKCTAKVIKGSTQYASKTAVYHGQN